MICVGLLTHYTNFWIVMRFRCVCSRSPTLLFSLMWFGITWLDSLFLSRDSCLLCIMWLVIYRETLNITRSKFYFGFKVSEYTHLILGANNVIQYCVGLLGNSFSWNNENAMKIIIIIMEFSCSIKCDFIEHGQFICWSGNSLLISTWIVHDAPFIGYLPMKTYRFIGFEENFKVFSWP